MNLKEEINKLSQQALASLPAEIGHKVGSFISSLVAADPASKALKVGDTVTDFTLPDHSGTPVSLFALLEQGPVILSFNRGTWCPFCSLEFKALKDELPEIKKQHATLLSVSPQLPEAAAQFIKDNGIDYPVLFDKDNLVAKQFGVLMQISEEINSLQKSTFGVDLEKHNGNTDNQLPIPAVFIIGKDKKIVYASVNPNWMQRENPADYVALLHTAS